MIENLPVFIVTASTLRHLTMCNRRVWLDHYRNYEEKDPITPITAFRLAAGIKHETEVHEVTAPQRYIVTIQGWSDGVHTTSRLIQDGSNIIGAYLEAEITLYKLGCVLRIRGKIDRLWRVALRLHQGQITQVYLPIEIKSYQQITPADQLQLDCYIWLLNQIDNVQALRGEFWLGQAENGKPEQRLAHLYDEIRLLNAFNDIARLYMEKEKEPPIFLTSHCKPCQWRSACSSKAEAQFDVSLIPSLRQETREDFRNAGIVTLNQIVELHPHELRKFRGIKTSAEAVHAQARAWIEKKPIWYGSPSINDSQEAWLFDLETNPSSQEEVWSIGWGRKGNVDIVIVAPEHEIKEAILSNGQVVTFVPDAHTAWLVFMQAVSVDNQPIFHWAPYDKTALRKTAPERVVMGLQDRFYDLHRVFIQSVKLPIDGNSLKVVAKHLGFHWSGTEHPFFAYANYCVWLKTGDVDMLTSSCAYQSDDIHAVESVLNWLISNAPERLGASR